MLLLSAGSRMNACLYHQELMHQCLQKARKRSGSLVLAELEAAC